LQLIHIISTYHIPSSCIDPEINNLVLSQFYHSQLIVVVIISPKLVIANLFTFDSLKMAPRR